MSLPILYSFRRCPYAIRARMALRYAAIEYELREVSLKNKPAEMLAISPKGTTPVLQLTDGRVLEESLDIMEWAVEQHDPDRWNHLLEISRLLGKKLITINDLEFKQALDRYKYANRFPEATQETYRSQAETFLQTLESLLSQHAFLLGDRISLADIAIFPFIRQFAQVDLEWFQSTSYNHLQQWLSGHEHSMLFQEVMQKVPVWVPKS
ncbi:glutathione S-transferase [Tumidithrix elongata RA019]|uniref:Glutathione S-transferase n=1 Tax=Tumidithrix elongata BACA0141 TaxID=2716417 RepID=A0AAW9Q1Y2_9CYAN|nr:glutathione S-transferase [Tumidithrix elongata RA019]